MTRPALDRIPEDLLTMPAADALAKLAVWLEDCDDHIALGRPGGLPAPPFKLSQAWVIVRQAASPPASQALANALTMTGCRDEEDLIDMANVGQGLLERIDLLTKTEGPFKHWTPADDPCEIVFDLVDALDDALAAPAEAQARVEALEACLTTCATALELLAPRLAQLALGATATGCEEYARNARALLSGSTPKPAAVEITEEIVERIIEAITDDAAGTHQEAYLNGFADGRWDGESEYDPEELRHGHDDIARLEQWYDGLKGEFEKRARAALTAALSGDAG